MLKKVVSILLAFIIAFSFVGAELSTPAASLTYAETALENIQKQSGFVPGKTSAVTGNCYFLFLYQVYL